MARSRRLESTFSDGGGSWPYWRMPIRAMEAETFSNRRQNPRPGDAAKTGISRWASFDLH
jgi:hypothetical protein